jgi:hypothetical protein
MMSLSLLRIRDKPVKMRTLLRSSTIRCRRYEQVKSLRDQTNFAQEHKKCAPPSMVIDSSQDVAQRQLSSLNIRNFPSDLNEGPDNDPRG